MEQSEAYNKVKVMRILFTNRKNSSLINRWLLGLIFLVLLTSCTPQSTPIPEFITSEEYQVYHDLLLENPDMWNVPPGAQYMIIFDQSYVRPEPHVVYSLLQNKEGISEQLMANFLEANQKPYFFEDQFNLGIPVTFVSDVSIQNLMRGLRFAEQCQYSIEAIYPRPEYGGFYYLSRVGFDASKKTALLYIEKSICGGNGVLLILKKEGEAWIITDFGGALNSDLGLYLADALSEEEHAVHNALLFSSMEFIPNSGYQYITIYDQTGLPEQLTQLGENLFSLINKKIPSATEDMVNNLAVINAKPYDLAPRFTFEVPVILVSWQEYETLRKESDDQTCLSTIQARFPQPDFQGWIRFSRVGFNHERDQALVFIELNSCKPTGFIVLLEKQNDSWYVQDFDIVQISTKSE